MVARAKREGRNAYVTTLDGRAIAFTETGWLLQEDVDARLAQQQRRSEQRPDFSSTETSSTRPSHGLVQTVTDDERV
jgi:hypothetical protein